MKKNTTIKILLVASLLGQQAFGQSHAESPRSTPSMDSVQVELNQLQRAELAKQLQVLLDQLKDRNTPILWQDVVRAVVYTGLGVTIWYALNKVRGENVAGLLAVGASPFVITGTEVFNIIATVGGKSSPEIVMNGIQATITALKSEENNPEVINKLQSENDAALIEVLGAMEAQLSIKVNAGGNYRQSREILRSMSAIVAVLGAFYGVFGRNSSRGLILLGGLGAVSFTGLTAASYLGGANDEQRKKLLRQVQTLKLTLARKQQLQD